MAVGRWSNRGRATVGVAVPSKLKGQLDNIWIDSYKLWANISRFDKSLGGMMGGTMPAKRGGVSLRNVQKWIDRSRTLSDDETDSIVEDFYLMGMDLEFEFQNGNYEESNDELLVANFKEIKEQSAPLEAEGFSGWPWLHEAYLNEEKARGLHPIANLGNRNGVFKTSVGANTGGFQSKIPKMFGSSFQYLLDSYDSGQVGLIVKTSIEFGMTIKNNIDSQKHNFMAMENRDRMAKKGE
ncbi:hypothetical protein RIF29_15716 [Crotalaria pallida]|uniref:Uncharacterized protein n=1 Tax=Crotalaria pallida TaxID=3830 RepID=A0AAN9FJL2_CROPI